MQDIQLVQKLKKVLQTSNWHFQTKIYINIGVGDWLTAVRLFECHNNPFS